MDGPLLCTVEMCHYTICILTAGVKLLRCRQVVSVTISVGEDYHKLANVL